MLNMRKTLLVVWCLVAASLSGCHGRTWDSNCCTSYCQASYPAAGCSSNCGCGSSQFSTVEGGIYGGAGDVGIPVEGMAAPSITAPVSPSQSGDSYTPGPQ